MQTFTILVKQLFCSTAKGSLSNLIPILYPEICMLCKKPVYDGLSLELHTLFDFQLRTQSVHLPLFNYNVSSVG